MASKTKATITDSKKEAPRIEASAEPLAYPVWYGGLMRCCIGTAEDKEKGSLKVGDKFPCRYCKSIMILKKDGIHWDGGE